MPIYNTKNIVDFVNNLESKLNEVGSITEDWDKNKAKVLTSISKIEGINVNAVQSLVKADEALSELSTATFTSAAARGKRLEDTLNKLKQSIFSAIENGDIIGIGSGGGELTGGMFYEELNNAIAEVDPTIEDGIKLDYRLRSIQEMAARGEKVGTKDMLLPQKYFLEIPKDIFVDIPKKEDQRFVLGDVTVLGEDLLPTYQNDEMITGTISEEGRVILTAIPEKPVYLYYPVQMDFLDIPQEFGYLFFDLLLDKHSPIMRSIVKIQDIIDTLAYDLDYMKGEKWTPDFSIMSNHKDFLRETLTPKGINVDVQNGQSVVSFSYEDNEMLSHFIAETWNEETQKWEPINNNGGVINK